ncbi:MAG: hypothetical protein ACJA0C_000579 [Candidatus Endobugula sp.]|jgi:hypothetical protein
MLSFKRCAYLSLQESSLVKKNIFLSMLEITKNMHHMAESDEWSLLGDQERERQNLINQLRSSISEGEKEDQEIIIEIIKEINVINQKINLLAEEKNTEHKTSLIRLQKGKKANNLYLE